MPAPGGFPRPGTTRAIIPRIDQPDVAETPTSTRSRVLTGYRPTGLTDPLKVRRGDPGRPERLQRVRPLARATLAAARRAMHYT